MHNLVAEDRDEPSRRGDYDDTSVARNAGVDCVDQLGANYDIHGGPAHTSEDVEARNCGATLAYGFQRGAKGMWGQEKCFIGGGST